MTSASIFRFYYLSHSLNHRHPTLLIVTHNKHCLFCCVRLAAQPRRSPFRTPKPSASFAINMWLINVKTRALEEYFGNKIPPYAILSHTWEEEEVSYKQYMTGSYKHLKGYKKIDMTCHIALRDGIDYAWVDTCCIDKSSSAELSEAINSMFRWYQRAEVCYVYLSDLLPGVSWRTELEKCRWSVLFSG